jgi:hypothetical protein
MFATRSATTSVFPVPGPAMHITGPSTVSTARFWLGFNRSYAPAKADGEGWGERGLRVTRAGAETGEEGM